jgi:adenine phosphoribosyltransferase
MERKKMGERLKEFIRDIPDFPKPGIVFKDISPLLENHMALNSAIESLCQPYEEQNIDVVLGIEARGFIFGPLVAQRLQAGFVPLRKPGKLPADTFSVDYQLEYGSSQLHMHKTALSSQARVLIIDDVIATGGTAHASIKLAEKANAFVVGLAFLIEIDFLKGRDVLKGYDVHSVIAF